MKRLFLLIVVLASIGMSQVAQAQILNVPTVGARDENAMKFARNNVMTIIRDADEMYRKGQYNNAKWEYQRAQSNNDQWEGKLYNSRELQRKIDDCQYAMDHGKTRQEANREAGENLANAIIGAIAGNSNQHHEQQAQPVEQKKDDPNELYNTSSYGYNYRTMKGNQNCKVKRIEVTASEVMVEFEYHNTYGKDGWIRIGDKTYLKDHGNNNKSKMTRCEGIKIKEKTPLDPNEMATFRLYFPALSSPTAEFDIVEPDGFWVFYGLKK